MSEATVLAEHNGIRLIAEEEGGAVFAYLWSASGILADVWLFNTSDTPTENPWDHGATPPCPNSSNYFDANEAEKRNPKHDELAGQYDDKEDAFLIADKAGLLAKVKCGDKPGQNTLVLIDGPLARRMGAIQ